MQQQVWVSAFSISKYEVTQKDYRDVMGTNPSHFKGDSLPVENVSWVDAIEYCNKRSLMEKLTPAYTIGGSGDRRNVTWNRDANGYRLPTEAEWEYACRAGTTTPYSSGDSVDSAGWHSGNSGNTTHPVGQKQANAWGLYDMHGNVSEWCWDEYTDLGVVTDVRTSSVADSSSRSDYAVRGGAWNYDAQNLRSAYRGGRISSSRGNHVGFRLVRP
jgi:formylglycine-generating enzyme required for sulfatase activity